MSETSPSANLLLLENWERIGKFLLVNVGVGVLLAFTLVLVINIFMDINATLTILLVVGLILSANALILSTYESWRGCKI